MKLNHWLLLFLLTITLINYPNPFNPKGKEVTTFEVTSDATLEATLSLYDLAACLVFQKTFPLQAGTSNRITWDGYNYHNERVSTGIYLCRLLDSSSKKLLAKTKVWVINH